MLLGVLLAFHWVSFFSQHPAFYGSDRIINVFEFSRIRDLAGAVFFSRPVGAGQMS